MDMLNVWLKKLRDFPLRLKILGGVIAFDLFVLVLGYLVLDDVMAERVAAVDQARAQLTEAKKQNADLRRQLDSYPQLRHHYDDVISSGLAASLDRRGFVQFAQSQATQHYLTDLRFRLADEPGDREHSPQYRVEIDRVVFESGGLLDTEAISFWEALLAQANGHYRVAEASLERVQEINPVVLGAVRRGTPISLLKAKIDMQWIGVRPLDQEGQ